MYFALNFGLVFSSIFSIFAYNYITGAGKITAPAPVRALKIFSSGSGSDLSKFSAPAPAPAPGSQKIWLRLQLRLRRRFSQHCLEVSHFI